MRIKNYDKDLNVTGNDKWIGSDFNNQNRTKNFTPTNLAEYFNHNQVINNVSLGFMYQTLDPGEQRADGTISFVSEIATQIPINTISTFLLSKKTLKGNDVSAYEAFLNNSKVLLSKGDDINNFGFFKITNIEDYVDDNNFYQVSLTFISGNGFLYEDKDYLISLIADSDTLSEIQNSNQNLQQVTDNGSTTTNTITAGGFTSGGINIDGYIFSSHQENWDANLIPYAGLIIYNDLANSSFSNEALYIGSNDNSSYSVLDYSGELILKNSSSVGGGVLGLSTLSENRQWNLPNNSGTIALTSDIPSLSGYANETWVGNNYYPLSSNPAGYLTSASLSGYATQSWVTSQGYITSSALSPYLLSTTAASTYFPIPTGNTSQYIRGDGTLATFPTIPSIGTWGSLNYPTWSSGTPFVKMTAAGTFALDTNTYLTSSSLSGYVPYNGATADVDLGAYNINTNKVILGGSGKKVTQQTTAVSTDRIVEFQDKDYTIAGLDDIPTALSSLTDDSTHRLVTDTKISTWDSKQDALGYTAENSANKSDSYTASSSTTYTTTKALVDGLATKQSTLSFTPYKYVQTSQTAHTGTSAETILATATITGSKFNANDVMKLIFGGGKTGTNGAYTIRVKINTTNTLASATTIATFTAGSSTAQYINISRSFSLSGGNLIGAPFTNSLITDIVNNAGALSSTAYNTANTLYLFFTIQLVNSGDTFTPNLMTISN